MKLSSKILLAIYLFSCAQLTACANQNNTTKNAEQTNFFEALKDLGDEMQANSDPYFACTLNQKKAIAAGLQPPDCGEPPRKMRCTKLTNNSIECEDL